MLAMPTTSLPILSQANAERAARGYVATIIVCEQAPQNRYSRFGTAAEPNGHPVAGQIGRRDKSVAVLHPL